ncbi:MAG: DUF1934 domain-containing protein [Lachnospiraceae bacterium]|nr:DUF1934 domain-containing protein [Lachnospiraceae bacterium]
MIKDVWVKITGHQTGPDGTTDVNEQEFPAQYFNKNNFHYIISENERLAKSERYKFNHRFLEVIRDGDTFSKLTFDAGKMCRTNYKTPYGRMEFTFNTHQITLNDSPEEIRIEINYEMLHNEKSVSTNRTILVITPNSST